MTSKRDTDSFTKRDTDSLLALDESEDGVPGEWRYGRCAPVRRFFTLQNVKIMLCLILTLIALVFFAVIPEKEEEILLCATSNLMPFEHMAHHVRSDLFYVKISTDLLNRTTLQVDFYSQAKNESNWTLRSTWEASPLLRHEHAAAKQFNLKIDDYENTAFKIIVTTNSTMPLGFSLELLSLHNLAHWEVLIATIILVLLYILIINELLPNAIASMMCAFLALGTYSQLYYRPTLEEVIEKIDFETLGILFGMMIMIGIFSTTGFFEYVAIKTYKYSGGNIWYLALMLCFLTAFLSAFLDNVTTILLVGPVTMKLCKVLDIPPKYLILSEVIFSNIGGAATVIGDPPNIIIANNPTVQNSGINFGSFTVHVLLPLVILCFMTALFIWKFYSKEFVRLPNATLETDIVVWKRTLAKFKSEMIDFEPEESIVQALENHISDLEMEAAQPHSLADISDLEAKYPIHNQYLFITSSMLLTIVIILFFLSTVLDLSLAWIAVTGAMVHVIIAGIRNVDDILQKVEWGTLIFFASLFILMETLDDLGLMDWIADKVISLIFQLPEEGNGRLLLATFIIVWIAGIAAAFLDSLPTTTTLLPIVIQLSISGNLPLRCLIWALALGVCLGANATVIGAPVNVVAVGLLESVGADVTFWEFMKFGAPIALFSLVVANIYVLIKAATGWY